eukprot:TRINITY_DN3163_c0_g2_i4.p1 TRINITY_DN3163_c0_g2~~TRINITY_DN3163_c0_g2_i4.p1  ORF type:complete len:976 (+),score=240.92 TRINITY_DN3163_c0_g2_i4:86-3013(+)
MSAASSAGAGVLTPFRRRSPAPGIPEPSRAEAADGRLSSGIGGRSPGKSPSQQPFVASASGIVWAASGGPMCLSASTFGTSLGWPGEESQAAADEIPETPHWALRSGQPWTPMRDAGRLFSIADNEAGEAAARAGDDAAAFGAEGGRAEQTASEADEAPSRSKRPRLLEKGLEEEEIAHEDSTGAAMALKVDSISENAAAEGAPEVPWLGCCSSQHFQAPVATLHRIRRLTLQKRGEFGRARAYGAAEARRTHATAAAASARPNLLVSADSSAEGTAAAAAGAAPLLAGDAGDNNATEVDPYLAADPYMFHDVEPIPEEPEQEDESELVQKCDVIDLCASLDVAAAQRSRSPLRPPSPELDVAAAQRSRSPVRPSPELGLPVDCGFGRPGDGVPLSASAATSSSQLVLSPVDAVIWLWSQYSPPTQEARAATTASTQQAVKTPDNKKLEELRLFSEHVSKHDEGVALSMTQEKHRIDDVAPRIDRAFQPREVSSFHEADIQQAHGSSYAPEGAQAGGAAHAQSEHELLNLQDFANVVDQHDSLRNSDGNERNPEDELEGKVDSRRDLQGLQFEWSVDDLLGAQRIPDEPADSERDTARHSESIEHERSSDGLRPFMMDQSAIAEASCLAEPFLVSDKRFEADDGGMQKDDVVLEAHMEHALGLAHVAPSGAEGADKPTTSTHDGAEQQQKLAGMLAEAHLPDEPLRHENADVPTELDALAIETKVGSSQDGVVQLEPQDAAVIHEIEIDKMQPIEAASAMVERALPVNIAEACEPQLEDENAEPTVAVDEPSRADGEEQHIKVAGHVDVPMESKDERRKTEEAEKAETSCASEAPLRSVASLEQVQLASSEDLLMCVTEQERLQITGARDEAKDQAKDQAKEHGRIEARSQVARATPADLEEVPAMKPSASLLPRSRVLKEDTQKMRLIEQDPWWLWRPLFGADLFGRSRAGAAGAERTRRGQRRRGAAAAQQGA